MPTVEYGSKSAVDNAREQWADHLCPDDDRRLKTVRFRSDVPDDVLERAELEAAESLGERESGPGQLKLTDHEKDRIDFSKARANVPWAQSIKAIAKSGGVDDWTAHVDPTLTVDEHREVMEQAARDDRGSQMDAEESARERAGRHSRRAQANECDHARGHCENGSMEACEELRTACGYDDSEVDQIIADAREVVDDSETDQTELVTVGGDDYPEMEVTKQQAGALRKSWQGYKGAIGDIEDALATIREAVPQGRRAIKAINSIREANGRDELHPDKLHDHLEGLDGLPGTIPETRTLDHFRDGSDDDPPGAGVAIVPDEAAEPAPGMGTGKAAVRPIYAETPENVARRAPDRPETPTQPPGPPRPSLSKAPGYDADEYDTPRTIDAGTDRRTGRFSLSQSTFDLVPRILAGLRRAWNYRSQDHYPFTRDDVSELIGRFNSAKRPMLDLTPEELDILGAGIAEYAHQQGNDRYTSEIDDAILDAEDDLPGRISDLATHGRQPLPDLDKAPSRRPEYRTIDPDDVGGQNVVEGGDTFASNEQGRLAVGVEPETTGDKQVTLTGDDASDPHNQTVPPEWEPVDYGTNVTGPVYWQAGPWYVGAMTAADPPNASIHGENIGDERIVSHPDPQTVQKVAERFTELVDPREVTMHKGDATIPEAAAQAKKDVLDGLDIDTLQDAIDHLNSKIDGYGDRVSADADINRYLIEEYGAPPSVWGEKQSQDLFRYGIDAEDFLSRWDEYLEDADTDAEELKPGVIEFAEQYDNE